MCHTVVGPCTAGGLDLQRTLIQLEQTVLQCRIVNIQHIGASIFNGYHCRHIVDTRSNIVSDRARYRHPNDIVTVVQCNAIA